MLSHQISPLRYPGGKASLAPFIGRLIAAQPRRLQRYVEPFAGGAGAALRLLCDEYVDEIVLNDLDRGVAAFWRLVFWQTDELLARIEECDVSIETWRRQQSIYTGRRNSTDDMELGFAAFFLNRTNRSGILDARPIGGLDQAGRWKLNARFNAPQLASRIRFLGNYRNRVTVREEDGIDVVASSLDKHTFTYVDPPYLAKGSDLYMDMLEWADHRRLASALVASQTPWLVTYDHDPRVPGLYEGMRRAEFRISHTAARQHLGQEYALFSDGLRIDDLAGLGHDAELCA